MTPFNVCRLAACATFLTVLLSPCRVFAEVCYMHRSSERILRNCNDSDPKMVRCNLGDEGFYPVDEATWRPMKDDEPDCILESEPLQIGVGQPLRGEEGGSTLPAEADW